MDFTFSLGYLGAALLIVGVAAIGVIVYLIGRPHFGYEWLLTAIAAVVGGFVASEFIVAFRTWEPVVDGLATVPAMLGGAVVGVVTAAATRVVTADTVAATSAH
ncbi:MAG: hypothetical protein WD830_10070 [Chloroflexota bacterium]